MDTLKGNTCEHSLTKGYNLSVLLNKARQLVLLYKLWFMISFYLFRHSHHSSSFTSTERELTNNVFMSVLQGNKLLPMNAHSGI